MAPTAKPASKPAAAGKKDKKLPAVPESKLKDAKRRLSTRGTLLLRKRILKSKVALRKRQNLIRAERYTRTYLKLQKKVIEEARQAKKAGNIYIPERPKIAVVIRIRGINKVAPKVKKVLQLLRLRQIGNATFVKLNKATLNMLRIAQPYITYGYPSLKTIRDLLYKRGFVKHAGRRIPITDNFVIERKLRHGYNVQCVEDLVYQLYTVGRVFKQVNNFLWPFKLNTPTGGWRKKNNHYVDGGDFGNREDKINELLQRMI